MPTAHYLATHSTGVQHVRSSSRDGYAWAVVYPRIGCASFSARRDLAQSEHSRGAQWHSDGEVVPAVKISAKEAAAIKKAQKVKVSVEFAGKTWTHTTDIDKTKPVAAVGVVRETYRVPFTMDATWNKAWWDKFPDGNGYHEYQGRTEVNWFHRLADAEKYAATKKVGELGVTVVEVITL